ncbi:MAG: hypothetical protein KY397_07425 [Gemmatimonadetes bacterium]|nr:hypothetical protein [Gemmatimonadota bacterium]
MAKDVPTKSSARPSRPTLSFSRTNGIWLGLGTLVIVVGYALLARGDTTFAPVLLVLGYCVLLPVGIVKK